MQIMCLAIIDSIYQINGFHIHVIHILFLPSNCSHFLAAKRSLRITIWVSAFSPTNFVMGIFSVDKTPIHLCASSMIFAHTLNPWKNMAVGKSLCSVYGWPLVISAVSVSFSVSCSIECLDMLHIKKCPSHCITNLVVGKNSYTESVAYTLGLNLTTILLSSLMKIGWLQG